MSNRLPKINKLIRENISEILNREIDWKPGVFVTVAKVDTTSDLRYTRVFISIFPEKETGYALKTLEKEMYRIQGQFNRKLFMKPLPKIEFRPDTTEARADEVEKLLKEIHPLE